MIRAVLDPNVLISAFVSRRGGAPDLIVRAWRDGAFDLIVSTRLVDELTVVLGRDKFALQAAEGRAEAYIGALVADGVSVADPDDVPHLSPDPDDDYLIALARAAHADAIVSGDGHLLGLNDLVPTVLTPRRFVQRFLTADPRPR